MSTVMILLVSCPRGRSGRRRSRRSPRARLDAEGLLTVATDIPLRGSEQRGIPLGLAQPSVATGASRDWVRPTRRVAQTDLGLRLQFEGRVIKASEPDLDECVTGIDWIEQSGPTESTEAASLIA